MRHALVMALGPFILLSSPGAAVPDDPPGAQTFELEEGRAADFEELDSSLVRGAYADTGEERPEGLLGVPELVSEKPRFGVFPLGARRDPTTEGRNLVFALDEKDGTGTGYDLLYIDLDEDGDLSDETARSISEELQVEFDLGEGYGKRSVALQPELHFASGGSSWLSMYAPDVRHGKVEIGGKKYEIVLSQGYYLTGRFDRPHCLMVLDPQQDWWGADRLDSMRQVGEKYYTFSATPDGARFTVTPYEGSMGVFRVGPGGRKVERMAASGSLIGDHSVPVGKMNRDDWPDPAPECPLPVGNYRPYLLTVRFDSLTVDTSFNYYADGKPNGTSGAPPVLGIEIREDRPYVFDLSNPPEIIFTQPVELQRFKRGDVVRVEAVLTDPKLGLMIRDIERWKKKNGSGGWSDRVSLDPKVTVVDSTGEVRATGKMPFG